jgi:glucose dehydrogenase
MLNTPNGRLLLCTSLITAVALAADSSQPGAAPADWPSYGGGLDDTRYSTLTQINRENVANLRVAWSFDTGDAFPGSEFQCNPLIIGGVLYAVTPKANVVALDAASGHLLWRFEPNPGGKVFSRFGAAASATGPTGNKRAFSAPGINICTRSMPLPDDPIRASASMAALTSAIICGSRKKC